MDLSTLGLLVLTHNLRHIRHLVRTVYRQTHSQKIILKTLIQAVIAYFHP